MRDSDIRTAVIDWLGTKYGPESRIVEEMGIWSGSARIDIAVINGELQGFEIKSERDTLVRLENQARLYSQVFDRMTLVVAKRHLTKATQTIPEWWGIATAAMTDDGSRLRPVRRARQNPNIDPMQLARLLWRAESIAILDRHGFSRGFKSRSAEELATRLVSVLPLEQLSSEVRETLKRRPEWLGQPVGDQTHVTIHSNRNPRGSIARSRRTARDLLDSLIAPTSG